MTDVAVIGVAGRFPDADGVDGFWRNVAQGNVSTRPLSDEALRDAGVSDELLAADDYVRTVATLSDVDSFAGPFFGYSPAEAELIDPQHRLLLEACWEALESAGHRPTGDVGVFATASPSTYTAALQFARARTEGLSALQDMDLRIGGQSDFLASRVAYKLGLRGPSVAVQTACSSSLTAIHLARNSLLAGECDIALAAGAGFDLPFAGYRYQPGGILSRDGYCRAFDARSTGAAAGAAVGVVALRRLDDALAGGDQILAVVRGTAIGNDGAARPGFTAPSPAGPAAVVSAALAAAGVSGDKLCYVEAHGSGTPLGDHVELAALARGVGATTTRTGFCGLGSVKVNIGHADAAAGIAGFINAVQVVRTGDLPPHPLFEAPRDPGLLAGSPFAISAQPRHCPDPDRHVLVNSMGLGGTNAAAVLAAPPAPARPSAPVREVIRLVVSAQSRRELDAASRRLADALEAAPDRVADIAYTLRVGRRDFPQRRVVAAPAAGAAAALAAALRLPRPPAARTVRAEERRALVVPRPAEPLRSILEAALGTPLDTADEVPAVVPDGVFVLQASDPDDALCEAWLNGVPVDWSAVEHHGGRRVRLPTYPFERRRYWALTASPAPPPAAPTAPSATVDDLEAGLTGVWRELFGVESVGPDDEFGALGGTSLLSVRMALEVQRRTGVLVHLHRAGGSRATVRRLASIIRGRAASDVSQFDADLEMPLGPLAPPAAPGPDTLLTGGTGFVGAFLLRALLDATPGQVHCVVRAADAAAGWARLGETARRYQLPAPDPARVRVVPGDLADAERLLADLPVGHVVHAAARVAFTEPYEVLRPDVLGTAGLLRWMRGRGIADFSYVSSLAACGPALGTGGTLRELLDQPLDPAEGGYGVAKWVCERLLERAAGDGMRVRLFRPGLILGATDTGACNPRDVVWRVLAGGLAVGAHPDDSRPVAVSPVDVVAAAIVAIGRRPDSAGRAYHLVDPALTSPRGLFAMLADAGLPTAGRPLPDWQRLVAERALSTRDDVLTGVALYEIDRQRFTRVECAGWQGWLAATGRSSHVDGKALRASLRFLATQPGYQTLQEET